jgi:hypothetical protein
MKKINLFLLILGLALISFSTVKAINLNLEYPSFGGININDPDDQDLNEIIAWAYYFLVGISGFSAFFMFVWGGFQWSSSAGDPNKESEAKDKLKSASIGLLIILSAYLILRVVNPDLTTLKLPEIQ